MPEGKARALGSRRAASKVRPVASKVRPGAPKVEPGERYNVRQSRSVQSVWVWRGFLVMSLLAIGVVIVLAANGAGKFAIAWGVIAVGWFAISMWLWRQHHLYGPPR